MVCAARMDVFSVRPTTSCVEHPYCILPALAQDDVDADVIQELSGVLSSALPGTISHSAEVIRDLGARYNDVDANLVFLHPPPIQHPPPIRRAIARMRRKARNALVSKQKHGQTYARSDVSTGFMVTSGVG